MFERGLRHGVLRVLTTDGRLFFLSRFTRLFSALLATRLAPGIGLVTPLRLVFPRQWSSVPRV